MIEDARHMPDGQLLQPEICIVGAGAAGIAMALQFIDTGTQVLLLEAGGEKDDAETQALYEGSVADAALHSPADRYRQRRFGGSTTIWGGRCVPFDPIDFEPRDYIAHSGWPFDYEQLQRYYAPANRLCEAGEFAYTTERAFAQQPRPMLAGFHSHCFDANTLERFSCPTDFGTRYAHRLRAADNIRVILNANVTALSLNAGGNAVESITARTLNGKTMTVQAQRVVLAVGGLEVARLLLANRDVHPRGIGNQHDVVGRYYMCHLAGTIGSLQVAGPAEATVWHGYDVSDEGIYCRRRLSLVPAAQRGLGVGNFIARLHHPRIADPAHRSGFLSLLYLMRWLVPYEYAKRLFDGGDGRRVWPGHLRNVVLDAFGTLAFAWHLLRDRKLAQRKFPSLIITPKNQCYSLDFHAEQEPNRDSRVTLSDDCDALGQPRLHIDWRYTRKDVETVQRALALFAEEIARSGIGRFSYDPDSVEAEMTRYGAYGGHHIGTARMGKDPRSSVTDANGRVHGIDNLYIASSAVFPTSGQANPTLTIVALALRMADHFKQLQGARTFAPEQADKPILLAQAGIGEPA